MDALHATVAGIVFDGTGTEKYGFSIEQDGISGWFESPDLRREMVDRANQAGQFALPGYPTGRVTTISGLLTTASRGDQVRELNRLSALLMDGDFSPLVVQEETTTRAKVGRYGEPSIRMLVYGKVAQYQIQFWSPDPRRYGDEHTYDPGTVVDVYHYGTYHALADIEVTGVMGGYTLYGPNGKRYVVTQALSAGQTHRIEMRSGLLYRDGVLQRSAVGRSETWTIPPGARVTHTLAPASGSGQIRPRLRDAYI